MKAAIIVEDSQYRDALQSVLNTIDWQIEFFKSSSEFGYANPGDYDAIIVDQQLSTISGRELLKTISPKTPAQLFLIGEITGHFSEEDARNDIINGLIDKGHPENLVHQLRFTEVKIRLNKLAETEREKLNESRPPNGFSLTIDDGFAVIKIKEVLSELSKKKLFGDLTSTHAVKAIVSIDSSTAVASPFLGILVFIYKEFKNKGGAIVFFNHNNNTYLSEQLRICNLSALIPEFFKIEDAKEYLNKEVKI